METFEAVFNPADRYKKLSVLSNKLGPGIDAIMGQLQDGGQELQAVRFHQDQITEREAEEWLKAQDITGYRWEVGNNGRG